MKSLFKIFDLLIVVFVAIIPVIKDESTSLIIESIDSLFSSGDIFIKIGILIFKSTTRLSTALIKFVKLSSVWRSLKFGVLGEDIFIVM